MVFLVPRDCRRMVIRSTFFSLGMFVLLWGGIFFCVDRVLIHASATAVDQFPLWSVISTRTAENFHELSPPRWAPYVLMCLGSLTMLYSLRLRNKQA